jgi:hypothetical protein
MTIESALEAPRERHAGTPTGFRRLTPGLLKVDRVAEGFAGLPDGVTVPGQLLAAFKAAAPRLGLSPNLVHAVDWLFRFTQSQDWGRGGRPIVWPSADTQQLALGLSPTRTKAINRALIEAGIISMKDSPNAREAILGRRLEDLGDAFAGDRCLVETDRAGEGNGPADRLKSLPTRKQLCCVSVRKPFCLVWRLRKNHFRTS